MTGGPPAKGGTSPAHEVAPPVERSTGAADAVADPAGPGQATPDEQAAAPSPEQQATRSEGQLSAPTGGVDGSAGPGQAAPDERGAAPAGQEPQIGTFDVAPPQPVAVPAPVSDVPGPAGAPLAPTATPGSAGSANEPGPASSGLETEAAGPSQPTSPGLQPGGPNLGVPTTTAETTTPVATAPTPPPAEPLALQPGGPRLGSPLGNAVVHDFGHVAVGATSSPLVVEVSNSRSYPVEVRAVTTPGSPAFVIGDDTCTGATLASGATCRLSVTFAPQGPGVATSAVDLTLRHTCSSTEYFPCSWVPAEIQTGVPNFTSTPGPSGLPIIDWTAAVGTGQASLEVKGEAP